MSTRFPHSAHMSDLAPVRQPSSRFRLPFQIKSKYVTLREICQNTGFLWLVFNISKILLKCTYTKFFWYILSILPCSTDPQKWGSNLGQKLAIFSIFLSSYTKRIVAFFDLFSLKLSKPRRKQRNVRVSLLFLNNFILIVFVQNKVSNLIEVFL